MEHTERGSQPGPHAADRNSMTASSRCHLYVATRTAHARCICQIIHFLSASKAPLWSRKRDCRDSHHTQASGCMALRTRRSPSRFSSVPEALQGREYATSPLLARFTRRKVCEGLEDHVHGRMQCS